MRLHQLNEYDFAPGASLTPKRDSQIQFNRHGASTPDDDFDEEEDTLRGDAQEIVYYLDSSCSGRPTIYDVARVLEMDSRDILPIAFDLKDVGMLDGDLSDEEGTLICGNPPIGLIY